MCGTNLVAYTLPKPAEKQREAPKPKLERASRRPSPGGESGPDLLESQRKGEGKW
jgi:hypothetical protein